jgi:hypothetical protein
MMADRQGSDVLAPGARRATTRPRPVLTPTQEEWRLYFRRWKRRRMVNNEELSSLIGLSVSTIDQKLNGWIRISVRLPIELGNIDRVISLGGFPENCPPRMRRNIINRRVR